MTTKERYEKVLDWFEKERPAAQTELHYGSAFQLLVAVVLSAQCTDKRVNMVTPALFEAYPDAESMAKAEPDDVLKYISSVSYPNSKSRHLVGLSRRIVDAYGGEVPDAMEDLMTLPGVGRKTANVIQAVIFGKARMAVDTHVFRVSHRIGLVPESASTPLAVERILTKHFPEELIPKAHHWLILHGRYTCTARNPKCESCGLNTICNYAKNHHS